SRPSGADLLVVRDRRTRALNRLDDVLLEQLDERRLEQRLPDELSGAAAVHVVVVDDLREAATATVLLADVRHQTLLPVRGPSREEVRGSGEEACVRHQDRLPRSPAPKTR